MSVAPAIPQRKTRRELPSDAAVVSGLRFMAGVLAGQAQTIWHAVAHNDGDAMESRTKAQQELEKIEQQIEQLESAAGASANQEARRQLKALHEQVNNLRLQI